MVRHLNKKAKVEEFYELREHIVRNIFVLTEIMNRKESQEFPTFTVIFDDYNQSGDTRKIEIGVIHK